MKAHIGVRRRVGSGAQLDDDGGQRKRLTQAGALLHGAETTAWGDAGYQGVEKRPEHRDGGVEWRVSPASYEHPFLHPLRLRQRYRGVAKNRQRIALLLGFYLLIAGRYA